MNDKASIKQYLDSQNAPVTPTKSQLSSFINRPMLWENPVTKKHTYGKPDELQKIIRAYTFLYNLGWLSLKEQLHYTQLTLASKGMSHPAFK